MLQLNSNYRLKNDALAKQPVYIVQIFFNKGKTGVIGINDIYFATCDVSKILNFPQPARWYPVLKPNSIGSLSQQVDPINGVSTIGNVNLVVTDYQHKISDVFKAADAAGHGLRRQRLSIYKLFQGMDWANRQLIRTMQVQDLKLSSLNEYVISAADVQKQLQKTVFNPYTTTTTAAVAASGTVSIQVNDSRSFKASTSVTYGTSGFILIDSEIMRWTVNANNTFSVDAADRGRFNTVAAAHAANATVTEIIYLNENPLTMVLKIIESSGVANANGAYDAYPAHWGCNMDSTNDVQESDWLQIGQLLTGLSATPLASDGLQFEFVINKGISAKKFIEDSILKILGAFGFVRGDGKYSIRMYNDIANTARENCSVWLTVDNVIKWSDLIFNYQDLCNELWIDYNEQPKLSGKYQNSVLFIDPVSKKKWGDAKQLKYAAQGAPSSLGVLPLFQRFQRLMARYSRPPLQISVTALPKTESVEIGDMVRVTLPLRDMLTGASLDRAFEVISTKLIPSTGEIEIKCIAQPESAAFIGGGVVASVTISPTPVSIVTGQTMQMVMRCYDANGSQINAPSVYWSATGNVTISSSGLVTAGAPGTGAVTALVGTTTSNAAAITVTAAANINPVASVAISPSTVGLSVGQTQIATALAYDVSGAVVNGKTFTWASSNPAVASVPAGPSTSATITAVANGTANITATETGSSIASPACAVTVAAPPTPTVNAVYLANSAYQVGTKITALGPVGGPHLIPNGYNFAAGDYWFDGDVSLALGSTCTINGTVRLFSVGKVTIAGTVNGKGLGVTGMTAILGGVGQSGTVRGFVGNGGNGGSGVIILPFGFYPGGTGASALNPSPPTLTLNYTSITSGLWNGVSGLPTVLHGSQSGSGGENNASPAGNAGNSGAGLMLMARQIDVTVGIIDLSATDGNAGSGYGGGGGGGCGGSFVALSESNANGIATYTINPNNINIGSGLGGGSVSASAGTSGGVGCKIIGSIPSAFGISPTP